MRLIDFIWQNKGISEAADAGFGDDVRTALGALAPRMVTLATNAAQQLASVALFLIVAVAPYAVVLAIPLLGIVVLVNVRSHLRR